MRELSAHQRKSHTYRLAEDLEKEGVHVVADFDDGDGEQTYRTAREMYDAFTTCDMWWCEWHKGDKYLGRVLVIPRNDIDLISDYTLTPEGLDIIHDLLQKIGWAD